MFAFQKVRKKFVFTRRFNIFDIFAHKRDETNDLDLIVFQRRGEAIFLEESKNNDISCVFFK